MDLDYETVSKLSNHEEEKLFEDEKPFVCKAEFISIEGAYRGEIEITHKTFSFKSVNEV